MTISPIVFVALNSIGIYGIHVMKISFKSLAIDNLKQLHQWFQEPVIKQLYAKNQTWSLKDVIHKYQPRINGKENIPSFIIEIDNQSLGFIQYYNLQEHLPDGIECNNPLFKNHLPSDIAGIDIFIAEQKNRSKGLGAQIINQFISEFLMRYRLIVVDPERNNPQAIRCYEKSGFIATEFSSDETHLLLMKKTKTP